jgi:glycosyltransferase involved in cell wall biosynthesis
MTTSVALCTYNGEKFLQRQLYSIAAQTKPVDEIIICDDGSKDSTCKIINEFIKTVNIPVRIIENAVNLGFTKNFEQAISLCSNDIIFLSDQDDIWMVNKVERICDFFEHNSDVELVFSNAELINVLDINSYSQTLFDVLGWNRRTKRLFETGNKYEVFSTNGRVTGATVAVKSSFIPYCFPFPKLEVDTIHDQILSICASCRNKIDFIDECLIKYRLHEGQSVGIDNLIKNPPQRFETAESINLWYEDIIACHSQNNLEYARFVHKRFWTYRKKASLFVFPFMLMTGQYGKFYKRSFNVFLRDMAGVLYRIFHQIKNIPNLRIVNVETLK